MKPRVLYNIISHFFMVLFVYTALAKLFDIHTFKIELESSAFLTSIAGIVSWSLPITELVIVILLFIPHTRLKGLYGSLILMFLFTTYLLGIHLLDNTASCSCGGIIENLRPGQHVAFNLACSLLACIGIYSAKRQRTSPVRFAWINTSLTLVMFLYISWVLLTAATAPPITKTGKEGAQLPSFNILLLDSSTHLNTNDIPEGESFIVIGFSPFCPHCKREIRDITYNIQKFHNARIYLISTFPITDLRKFANNFTLAKFPNISVGMVAHNEYLSYFNWHSIPFTTIYDSKKRLEQAIAGRVQISTLVRCIN